MKKMAMLVAVASLTLGCATANQNVAKVLVVACDGCGMLTSSGVCAMVPAVPAVESGSVTSSSRATPEAGTAAVVPETGVKVNVPKCAAPKVAWIVNFSDVMDKKAAPVVECR